MDKGYEQDYILESDIPQGRDDGAPAGRMPGVPGVIAGTSGNTGQQSGGMSTKQHTPTDQLFYRDGTPYMGPQQLQHQQQHLQTATTLQAGLSAAGLTPAHMGLSDDFNFIDNKGAGEGDLLSTLSMLGDASRRKRSRHWLRPDHHIPQDKLFSEMSYRELMYGMCCVQRRLLAADLPQWSAKAYNDHMRFVAMKGLSASFTSSALAKYEHDLTTKVMDGDINGFMPAEHEAVYTHLGAENLSVVMELRAEIAKLKANSQRQNSNKKKAGGQGYKERCPDGVCAAYNYTHCGFNPCFKSHSCAICGANHKAKDVCRARQQQPQQQHTQAGMHPTFTPPQYGQRPA